MKTTLRMLVLLAASAVAAALSAKPLIGINLDVHGDQPMDTRVGLSTDYIDAVTSAGGIPLLLPAALDPEAVDRYVKMCDGFVLTGGRDISPSRYGDAISTHTNLVNPRREQFDFALVDAVLKANKPVLGVCLGSQELNVALGGSMIQDLPTETSSSINHRPGVREPSHDVTITTGTRLHDIMGTSTLQVNSMHHQACGRLGTGVLVTARAPDDVVESFIVKDYDFAMGVQWHPEVLTDLPGHLKIYLALVEAAERNSRARR